jgi:hypothetical protein
LTRNLTNVPSQIEQAALSGPWISSTVYDLLLLFVIILTCLALLKLYLEDRKKAVFTVSWDGLTDEQIRRLLSSERAPRIVCSLPSGIENRIIGPRAKEPGWTSTLEIDDKPIIITSRTKR